VADTTYYADGEWNFSCDLCGKKEKSSKAMRTWAGFYVCRHHKEVRNPQDFVRGVRDNQTVPWSRHAPPDQFPYATALLQEDGSHILIADSDGWLLNAPMPVTIL